MALPTTGEKRHARAMTIERLTANSDDRVNCARRGEIDVEWCLGCPRRIETESDGDRVGIVCDPGTDDRRSHDPGPLRDLPDIWRTH
jgi:hypothetical protein